MTEYIKAIAEKNYADVVSFAPAERFSADDPVFKIFPYAKTVIGLGFRILRGTLRGPEEGSIYYNYMTMALLNMEETVMPIALVNIANAIEARGFIAVPQRRHQLIAADTEGTDPEMNHALIKRGATAENQLDFVETAVKCGLGEKGLMGDIINEDFGPLIRYCVILTDAAIEPDEIKEAHLCDGCKKCIKACPGGALSEEGLRDDWRCAVYYKGANGTKNPFMPPDAYSEFDDRLDIIAGRAEMDISKAKRILDATAFYGGTRNGFAPSICAKACHTACYVHLEEQGKLKRRFKKPFKRREEWKFDIEDFNI